MDSQTTPSTAHNTSAQSQLLIKLPNPFSAQQQTEVQNDQDSPKPSSPQSKPLKTPPLKKESLSKDDSLEETFSAEDNENIEDSCQKSGKRVYTKRTTDKIRRWTKEESKLYEQFIEMYSDIFNDSSSKRVTKIFIFMASYIGSKTPSQCRSHHQKFFRRIQREKLINSGQATNEEELERLMPPKKRKKKTEKAKENNSENQSKCESKLASSVTVKAENVTTAVENESNGKIKEPNGEICGNSEKILNGINAINGINGINGIANGYYPEENEQNVEIQQGQPSLNFIENDGYGKPIDGPSQFMNLKRNYEAFRKISVDDRELMNLFNNKTRRKSSISMLFNNNYFYQTDPELSNNLEFMHNKQPNFLDDQSNYPPILQPNGMYNGYVPPPPPYYYGNYPPPFPSNHAFNFGYEPSNNQPNNNEDIQDKTTNIEEKGSALLKSSTKPVIENQQILWNNAMENVDVIDQYLRSMEKS